MFKKVSSNFRYLSTNTDEKIAKKLIHKMLPITDIAKNKLNINSENIELYGKFKGKIFLPYINSLNDKKDGKLILVTALTPTKTGEGKTCTSVGLADGLCQIGKNAIASLREPSLGPVFGMKGGATGGGLSQIVPMDDINLHFTGDLHAISSAHNLLSAMIDNHIYWGNELKLDSRRITWPRVVDMNDRALRNITIGLGPITNGFPREDSYDITVASEIMAIFCLATDLEDLNKKLKNIIVGYTKELKPVTAEDLNADGAMTALLKDALSPNIVQTLEQNPAIIHGGPFANIAHGCSSIISTKTALKISDYIITEGGFGADLGAEKFFNIKCRKNNLKPDIAVIVATVRALKLHGGLNEQNLDTENIDAIKKGLPNLFRHIENIQKFNLPVVVAINQFPSDTQQELDIIKKLCNNINIEAVITTHHKHGGKGAIDLAKTIVKLIDNKESNFKCLYPSEMSLMNKVETIATEIYRAKNVTFEKNAITKFKQIEKMGFGHFPICIAKTQYSFSNNPDLKGAPKGHNISVVDVKLSAGAEFVIVFTGNIMTMPGLPKKPAAENIGVDKNEIYGLF